MFQSVTQGHITGYQVYYNGTMMNVNSSTITLAFTAPSLPDDKFNDTVVVMVTAVNKMGVGPVSDPATAVISGMSVSTHVYVYIVNLSIIKNKLIFYYLKTRCCKYTIMYTHCL